jgi:hypothetical protein
LDLRRILRQRIGRHELRQDGGRSSKQQLATIKTIL